MVQVRGETAQRVQSAQLLQLQRQRVAWCLCTADWSCTVLCGAAEQWLRCPSVHVYCVAGFVLADNSACVIAPLCVGAQASHVSYHAQLLQLAYYEIVTES